MGVKWGYPDQCSGSAECVCAAHRAMRERATIAALLARTADQRATIQSNDHPPQEEQRA